MKSALLLWGGWKGHEPQQCIEIMAEVLRKENYQVEVSDTLDAYLDLEKLQSRDLIVPCWTMGEITRDQFKNLDAAVRGGVGLAGWHGGLCDSFRVNTEYQFMTGGQWVSHPDNVWDYTVQITNHTDPITQGLKDFAVHSEQYYMHVDPSNEVLATTTFNSVKYPWVQDVVMPVVWKRQWDKGRVFYSSLGHVAKDFDVPEALEIARRGMLWATR